MSAKTAAEVSASLGSIPDGAPKDVCAETGMAFKEEAVGPEGAEGRDGGGDGGGKRSCVSNTRGCGRTS